jgi:hypothetical protein
LTISDYFSDLRNFSRKISFGLLNITNLLITFFGNIGQLPTECHYGVNSFLKGVRVSLILTDNVESLVRPCTKGIPGGVGGGALLLSKSGINGLMQSSVKVCEVSYHPVPVDKRIVKDLHCRSAYPLGANQNH